MSCSAQLVDEALIDPVTRKVPHESTHRQAEERDKEQQAE